ncbi:MAG: leucine-rich repeat protein [Clostridia bacterium]|nr:leucine-rich repeat protein [Clostridia bacterium]
MKKTLKSLFAGVLAVLLLVAAVPMNVLPVFIEANATTFTSGVYTYTVEDGNATITKADKSISGEVVIPETLGGYNVTCIGKSAFSICDKIKSIKVPDNVTSIGGNAFFCCFNLEEIELPDSITSIGEGAFDSTAYFADKNNWEYGVLYIDHYLIYAVAVGDNYVVKKGTTLIADDAFFECGGLQEIYVPSSVKYLGAELFDNCMSIEKIVIYNPDAAIGNWLLEQYSEAVICGYADSSAQEYAEKNNFNFVSLGEYSLDKDSENSALFDENIVCFGTHNKNLTWRFYKDGTLSIDGSGDMKAAGSYPWLSLRDKTLKIVIGEGVESIAKEAFQGFEAVEAIELPDSLLSIGESAFNGCISLEEVVLPDNVGTVGRDAFYMCESLKKVEIGASVNSIGSHAFLSTPSLESVSVDKENEDYSSENGVLFNKDKTELIVFPRAGSVTEYVVPDGVTSIVGSAFYGCRKLESIKLPDSLLKIGESAFAGCSKLKNVTISEGVAVIDASAFEECENLHAVEIPASVTTIGDHAFAYCSSLESITFYNPETEINMGDGTIPYSSTIYGYKNSTAQEYAHRYNMNFVEMENPNKVTSGKCGENLTWEYDGNGTVYIRGKGEMSLSADEPNWRTDFREAITKVVIADGVTSIDYLAFYGCVNLKDITIPDSVTSIGDSAFKSCHSLKKMAIPESVTKIGAEAFFDCSKLEEITLPSGITKVASWAFMDCVSLKNVVIPDGVTVIGGAVFAGCSRLESVTIPATVTTIHGSAFSGCTSLTDVYFLGTEKQWNAIICNDSTMGKENMSGLTDQIIHFANENIKTSDTAKDCIFALEGQTAASLGSIVSCTVKVLDKNSKAVSDKAKLATGMQMVLTDEKGNVLDTVTVVVPGDVNGDGEVKAADARSALRAAVKLDTLSDCEKAAADLDTTSSAHSVNSADARHILRMSVKLEDANDWIKDLK